MLIAVGGLDPSGGAGLVRDHVTARALGARIRLVGTAWTDVGEDGVTSFAPRRRAELRDALRRALADASGTPTSVKVGMVATSRLSSEIVAGLESFAGPVVFDPVLAASRGGSLFAGRPDELLPLVRRAWLVTPNLAEAAALAGFAGASVRDLAGAIQAARSIRAHGARAVLVKGGHLLGDHAIDVLVDGNGERRFAFRRVPGPSPRGTGCALATAIAVELARGEPLGPAIAGARRWLASRIRAAADVGGERHL